MATTYKDYYINYNGTRISNNEDTGLTAVNIYYNGTYLGEGAHTLNCAGQYMNGNVTIGARTLNCGGQYMNGNVQVLTQNRYKWYRYYANYVYYEVDNGVWSGDIEGISTYVYHGATSHSLNTSNGVYTLSGGQWEYIDYRWAFANSRVCVDGQQSNSAILRDTESSHIQIAKLMQSSTTGYIHVHPAYTTIHYMTSAGTWQQGSYIDTVQSTNPNAHTNGYNSDGYWYVAI